MTRIGELMPAAARALGLEDELRLSRAIATSRRSSPNACPRPPGRAA